MKVLTNYDFSQNQILNAVIQKLAIPPANPVSGQLYFDTNKKRAFIFDGTEWLGMDSIGATMTAKSIVEAINGSTYLIDDDNLSQVVRDAIAKSHDTHSIGDVNGLQSALDSKLDGSEIPVGAKFTDTITTIGGKTGAITKADIVGLGIPAQDTVYIHPDKHNISEVDGLQNALDGKVDDSQVLTNVPINAEFTDTVTTINGKTGVIKKEDITALGIPAQDTVYTHPTTDGNKHVPATGTTNSGKVLKAGATAGSLAWEDDNDTITTINGKTGAISKADIVAIGIPAQDTTYTPFTTAKDGLVPKTTSSNTTDYLRRDGTWASPPDTKYTLPTATSTVLGGIKSGTDITIDANGNVSVNDNSHNHTILNVTGLQDALNSKETPAGATAKASTAENNAKGYTDTKLAELVGSAPETLDTLHELAEALGSDPNFATTITNTLSQKTDKFVKAVGDNSKTSFVLTHNLNSRDVVITIRETASPYEQVITDIEFTTVNTVTVKFAKPPTANQYTVTIIG